MGAQSGQKVLAADFGESVFNEQTADILGFTNTTFQPGSPICGVSFVANTYGKAGLTWSSLAESNGARRVVWVSVYVRTGAVIGSGTDVLVPAFQRAVGHSDASSGSATRLQASRYHPLSGLTPGAVYNAVTVHAISGDNGDIFYRSIAAKPLP